MALIIAVTGVSRGLNTLIIAVTGVSRGLNKRSTLFPLQTNLSSDKELQPPAAPGLDPGLMSPPQSTSSNLSTPELIRRINYCVI